MRLLWPEPGAQRCTKVRTATEGCQLGTRPHWEMKPGPKLLGKCVASSVYISLFTCSVAPLDYLCFRNFSLYLPAYVQKHSKKAMMLSWEVL